MSNEFQDFSIILPRNRKTIYLTELDRRTSANFIKLARSRSIIPSTDIAGSYFTLEQIHKFSTLVNNNTINPDIVDKIHNYLKTRPNLVIVSNERNLSSRLTKVVRTYKVLSDIRPTRISRKTAYTKEQLIAILGVLSSKTRFEQISKLAEVITMCLDRLELIHSNSTKDLIKVPYTAIQEKISKSMLSDEQINEILEYIQED